MLQIQYNYFKYQLWNVLFLCIPDCKLFPSLIIWLVIISSRPKECRTHLKKAARTWCVNISVKSSTLFVHTCRCRSTEFLYNTLYTAEYAQHSRLFMFIYIFPRIVYVIVLSHHADARHRYLAYIVTLFNIRKIIIGVFCAYIQFVK